MGTDFALSNGLVRALAQQRGREWLHSFEVALRQGDIQKRVYREMWRVYQELVPWKALFGGRS